MRSTGQTNWRGASSEGALICGITVLKANPRSWAVHTHITIAGVAAQTITSIKEGCGLRSPAWGVDVHAACAWAHMIGSLEGGEPVILPNGAKVSE